MKEQDFRQISTMDYIFSGSISQLQRVENDHNYDMNEMYHESYNRAAADLEMLCAAYPNEISFGHACGSRMHAHEVSVPLKFPMTFTLNPPDPSKTDCSHSSNPRNHGAQITMSFKESYPSTPLEVFLYSISSNHMKKHIEHGVNVVRNVALEASKGDGEESGLSCCAAAVECWNLCLGKDSIQHSAALKNIDSQEKIDVSYLIDEKNWISSDHVIVDRKSVFQAHACVVDSEDTVRIAVHKLLQSSSRIQRATHNIFAFRFTERSINGESILKKDSFDDGEKLAGSRLGQLLDMRQEDGILVVVSRWYGGVNLGPKRCAQRNNVAKYLLDECHEKNLLKM